jgi:hypothetical protein
MLAVSADRVVMFFGPSMFGDDVGFGKWSIETITIDNSLKNFARMNHSSEGARIWFKCFGSKNQRSLSVPPGQEAAERQENPSNDDLLQVA